MAEEKKPEIQYFFDEYEKVTNGITAAGGIALAVMKHYVPQTEEVKKKQDELLSSFVEIGKRGAVLLGSLTGAVKYLTDENLALRADLAEYADCEICKYGHDEPDETCKESCKDCTADCQCAGCESGSKWTWQGPQK